MSHPTEPCIKNNSHQSPFVDAWMKTSSILRWQEPSATYINVSLPDYWSVCEAAKLICILCRRIAFVTSSIYIGAKHEAHLRRELSCCYYTRLDINYKQAGGNTPLSLSLASFAPCVCVCACGVWVRYMERRALSSFGAAERIISLIGSAPQNTMCEQRVRRARFNLLLAATFSFKCNLFLTLLYSCMIFADHVLCRKRSKAYIEWLSNVMHRHLLSTTKILKKMKNNFKLI